MRSRNPPEGTRENPWLAIPGHRVTQVNTADHHLPTSLTYLALWTLPAGPDHRIDLHRWVQTVTMVVLTTASAEKLLQDITGRITNHTVRLLTSYNNKPKLTM